MVIWHDGLTELERLTGLGAESMPGHLGIEFTGQGEDWLRARMPVDWRTHQIFGRLHGGASVALAETVGSIAGGLTVDPATHVVVGQEINANHIRPVRDGHVHATATSESRGRTSQVWTIRIVDDEDRLVCLSRLTLAVIPLDRR